MCWLLLTGFFFGMRRSIDRAAYDSSAGLLFDPSNRIIGQELDLYNRMVKLVCVHLQRLAQYIAVFDITLVGDRLCRQHNIAKHSTLEIRNQNAARTCGCAG